MKPDILIIKECESIKRLIFSYKRYKTIAVEIPFFSREENAVLAKKIVSNYFECGCKIGGQFMMMFFFVSVVYFIFNYRDFLMTENALYLFLLYVLCGLTGKVLGIITSRFKLYIMYKKIKMTCPK